ncbi:hypothetical protein ACFJIW_09995 [Tahibacter sp. UC22_41]|uniref:hypothetical protein n=1 Tax=Tahibacter sp. UC22_41 TaxID=3350178 RepID=UPI0036DC9B33
MQPQELYLHASNFNATPPADYNTPHTRPLDVIMPTWIRVMRGLQSRFTDLIHSYAAPSALPSHRCTARSLFGDAAADGACRNVGPDRYGSCNHAGRGRERFRFRRGT